MNGAQFNMTPLIAMPQVVQHIPDFCYLLPTVISMKVVSREVIYLLYIHQ